MTGEVPPYDTSFVPREQQPEPPENVFQQHAEDVNRLTAEANFQSDLQSVQMDFGLQAALSQFLNQPLPRSEDETKVSMDQMVELVKRSISDRDTRFGLHLQTSQVAQDQALAARGAQAAQEQMLATTFNQMLRTDARMPEMDVGMQESLAQLTEAGIPPEVVTPLREQYGRQAGLQRLVGSHTEQMQQALQEMRETGALARGARALGEGAVAGGGAGFLGEATTFQERAGRDISEMAQKLLYQAYPEQDPGSYRDPFAGLGPGLDPMHEARGPEGTEDVYRFVMGRQLEQALQTIAEEEGFEPQFMEKALETAGFVGGLAAPFTGAMRGGKAAAEATTGLARIARQPWRGAAEGLRGVGKAETALGKMAQAIGGQGSALFALGAGPVAMRTGLESPESQAEAFDRGIRTMVTAPLFMGSGRLGNVLAGKVRGPITKTAARAGGAATGFLGAGQALQYGEEQLRPLMDPEYGEKLRMAFAADPELQSALGRLIDSGGPGNEEWGSAVEDLMAEWMGNFAGFGALHMAGMFRDIRDEGIRKKLEPLAKKWQFQARQEINEASESPEVRAALGKKIDEMARPFEPSYGEREGRRLKKELREEVGEEGERQVSERLQVEQVKEGEARDLPGRLTEVQAARREADLAAERATTAEQSAERVAEAERLQAGEEYLRALQAGEAPKAASQLAKYQREKGAELMSSRELAEREGRRQQIRMEGAEGRRVARELLEERRAAQMPAEPAAPAPAPQQRQQQAFQEQTQQAAARGELPLESPPGKTEKTSVAVPRRKKDYHPVFKATEGDYRAYEGLSPELKTTISEVRQDPRMKGASNQDVAAESLYRQLQRETGESAVGKETAKGAVERLGREFEQVAEMGPESYLAWQKLIAPELHGPLGQVIRQWEPGRKLLGRMERHILDNLLVPMNEGELGFLRVPLQTPFEVVRMFRQLGGGNRALLERLDRFTEQSDRDILDPGFLDTSNQIWRDLGFVEGRFRVKDIPRAAATMQPVKAGVTALTRAKLLDKFAQPTGFAGRLATDMTEMTARVDKTLHDLLGNLRKVNKRLPAAPETAARDPLQYDSHLATDMLREGKAHPGWTETVGDRTPEQMATIREVAKANQDFLAAMAEPMAVSSRYAWWLEQQRRWSTARLRETEQRMEELQTEEGKRMAQIPAKVVAGRERARKTVQREREGRRRYEKEQGGREAIEKQEAEAKEANKRAQQAGEGLFKEAQAEGLRQAQEVSKRAFEPGEKEAKARQTLTEFSKELSKAFEATAQEGQIPSLGRFKAKVGELRNRRQRAEQRIAKLDADQQALVKAYQDANYVHDVFRADLGQKFFAEPQAMTERYGRFDQIVREVQTGAAKRKTGKMAAKGEEDPDIGRWMDHYIRSAVPYVENQRFLRKWEEKLEGSWQPATPKELWRGIDTSWGSGQSNPWYDATILYQGKPYQAVLGRQWEVRETQGGKTKTHYQRKRADPEDYDGMIAQRPVILLYRGSPGGKGGGVMQKTATPRESSLQDPGYVSRNYRDLVPVNQRGARDQILTRGGPGNEGFYNMAKPRRAESVRRYIERVFRASRELEPLIGLDSAAMKNIDQVLGKLGYLVSTAKLANPGSVARATIGAGFMNVFISGPKRAAEGLGYTTEYLRRLTGAKLKGHPDEKLPVDVDIGPEGVERIITGRAQSLRNGKNEVVDDLMEDMYASGILTGTRGFTYWERTPEKHRGSMTKRVLTEAGPRAMEALWQPWEWAETVVRTSLYSESYMAARADGRTRNQARRLAFNAVNQAHGVFNQALRSEFFSSGAGHFLGAARGWWSHWSGTLLRLPPEQKMQMFAYGAMISALGAAFDVDVGSLFTMYMHDIPGVGEEASAAIDRAAPGLKEAFPYGFPFMPLAMDFDTITVEAMGNLFDSAGAALEGRSEDARKNLYRGLAKMGSVTAYEDIMKWFAAEPDTEPGSWTYRRHFGTDYPQTVAEQGLVPYLLDGFFPRERARRAEDRFRRLLETKESRRREGKRQAGYADLERAFDSIGFEQGKDKLQELMDEVEGRGLSAQARRYLTTDMKNQRARAIVEDLPRLKEAVAEWQKESGEAGVEALDAEQFMRIANRAIGNVEGLRSIMGHIQRGIDKPDKMRRIAGWLDGPASENIPKSKITRILDSVSGQKSWSQWAYGDDAIPESLQDKFEKALAKRGIQ